MKTRHLFAIGIAVGVCAAALLLRGRAEQTPGWPSRKKVRRDARQAEARRREAVRTRGPGKVHVESEATPDLKVPLADLKH